MKTVCPCCGKVSKVLSAGACWIEFECCGFQFFSSNVFQKALLKRALTQKVVGSPNKPSLNFGG